MNNTLILNDLTTGYRGKTVLSNLSLAPLKSGQVVSLVGPNAAGKSTLLRVLAGLLPAGGTVAFEGHDLLTLSAGDRAALVGFMPQFFPSLSGLTVLDGLITALKAAPGAAWQGSRAVERRAVALLDRLGLAGLALSSLGNLSGGQRQMVSLAQAIIRSPRLILLDEPTSALDLRHQVEVMGIIRDLAAGGALVVMVVHDLALAARWSDHVLVLSGGCLHASGPPQAAISPAMLADVYGVQARTETCSHGHLTILVDGLGGAVK